MPSPEAVNQLGTRLSPEVCPQWRFPAYDKNLFECKHGFVIAAYRLNGTTDWSAIKEEHEAFVNDS